VQILQLVLKSVAGKHSAPRIKLPSDGQAWCLTRDAHTKTAKPILPLCTFFAVEEKNGPLLHSPKAQTKTISPLASQNNMTLEPLALKITFEMASCAHTIQPGASRSQYTTRAPAAPCCSNKAALTITPACSIKFPAPASPAYTCVFPAKIPRAFIFRQQ
jgi:hypothetical protein